MSFRARIGLMAALLGGAPAYAPAWGPTGHQIVAMIAEQRLPPEVRARVDRLLFDGQYTLAGISSCPDQLRAAERNGPREGDEVCLKMVSGQIPPNTGPWHYIDIPVPVAGTDLQQYCKDGNCVVDKIKYFRDVLKTSNDDGARRAALMFLVHFIGDIHQPLHCAERGCDHGGNLEHVNFRMKKEVKADLPLHGVWDSNLVDKLLDDAKAVDPRLYAESLLRKINDNQAAEWNQTTIEDVAWEGWKLAKDQVYKGIPFQDFCPQPPAKPNPASDLTSAYEKTGEKIVREQLIKAGVRLAGVIEKNLTR